MCRVGVEMSDPKPSFSFEPLLPFDDEEFHRRSPELNPAAQDCTLAVRGPTDPRPQGLHRASLGGPLTPHPFSAWACAPLLVPGLVGCVASLPDTTVALLLQGLLLVLARVYPHRGHGGQRCARGLASPDLTAE